MSGERTNFEERMNIYLSNVKGEKFDITAQIYKMLVQEEKAGEKDAEASETSASE